MSFKLLSNHPLKHYIYTFWWEHLSLFRSRHYISETGSNFLLSSKVPICACTPDLTQCLANFTLLGAPWHKKGLLFMNRYISLLLWTQICTSFVLFSFVLFCFVFFSSVLFYFCFLTMYFANNDSFVSIFVFFCWPWTRKNPSYKKENV